MNLNRKSFAALIIASSLAAYGGLAQAQTSPAVRSATATSGVSFMTGGVGLVARQELASQAGQYNLHLEFAYAPEGEYLSEVQVDINDARGNNVLSTRTDGPWLLARLPAGSYTVKASYGSVTRTQQVAVGGGKRHLVMRFPASVENMAGRHDAASVASR
jgi:hypothetical protein